MGNEGASADWYIGSFLHPSFRPMRRSIRRQRTSINETLKGVIMLITIISVLIGNAVFFGGWVLFVGFTKLKMIQKFEDDNPKGAVARESADDCDCGGDCC